MTPPRKPPVLRSRDRRLGIALSRHAHPGRFAIRVAEALEAMVPPGETTTKAENVAIGGKSSMSPRTIQKALLRLESVGLISRIPLVRGESSREIVLMWRLNPRPIEPES